MENIHNIRRLVYIGSGYGHGLLWFCLVGPFQSPNTPGRDDYDERRHDDRRSWALSDAEWLIKWFRSCCRCQLSIGILWNLYYS